MMNRLSVLAVLLLSAPGPACAPRNPPPVFAYDHAASFAGLKTWAWLDDPTWKMPPGSAIVDGQFIDQSIRKAVSESLTRKGLVENADGRADIYVAYHMDNAGVLSQDSFEKTSKTDFLLWSWDHLDYTGTQYSKRSALVLDFRNGEKKLVWRGARTANAGTNPEAIARGIQKAVNLLLAEFPPPSAKTATSSGAR